MTTRERVNRVLHFQPVDRMPKIEWAAWWNATTDRWKTEGLDPALSRKDILRHFDMEIMDNFRFSPNVKKPAQFGAPLIRTEKEYMEFRKGIYGDDVLERAIDSYRKVKEEHERGELAVRIWLDGFFWYPRVLLGIEPHLYAFYDQPELMHLINEDLCQFNCRAVDAVYSVMTPEFFGVAEDMSYNHGPMISHELFSEFLQPYYIRVREKVKQRGVPLLIDSDGDITRMIPWMRDAGIEGVYPLERQAGVDLVEIRRKYPDFLMMGGFDKMVMSKGEAAMRAEFERLLPVWRSGGFILSVDHQTPPQVSLENYGIFAKLYDEYAQKACE